MRPAVPSVVVVLALTLLAGCGGGGGGGGKPQQEEAAEQRERAPQPRQEQHTVVPTVETTPVSHSGDAADAWCFDIRVGSGIQPATSYLARAFEFRFVIIDMYLHCGHHVPK